MATDTAPSGRKPGPRVNAGAVAILRLRVLPAGDDPQSRRRR
ncbi:hypothetical protein I545_1159 [Mycobacterium kansasii 662]|uniref:Uncharacterized protein n=1 Tax=Mycobacterium kansasii 662 TaxID=1299326 RepID=X7ZPT7_MYCKA|nr:hypothetical protein I545_1159 [Mycobacterium kansasii 662]KEP42776.1 hypothetical protein MKSMC1_20700 [Mycobacterium kansasii]